MTSSVVNRRSRRPAGRRQTSTPPMPRSQEAAARAVPATKRAYKVQVSNLEDDPTGACVVDVSHADGTPIASGVGANQLETVQDAARYMLPENHPDYPKL
jgi:hypothetical protein